MATPTDVPAISTTRGVSFLPGKLRQGEVEKQIKATRAPEEDEQAYRKRPDFDPDYWGRGR